MMQATLSSADRAMLDVYVSAAKASPDTETWIRNAAAALVFYLQRMNPDTPIFRVWGFFTLRVSHVIRLLDAVFGPFTIEVP